MALRNFVFGLLAIIAGTAISIPAEAQSNRPPTISGVPATSATVGLPYTFQPTASDPDRWQWLRYSISNKPAWANFSSRTGRLTGTPSSSHVGTTTGIVIRVSDGRLGAALAPFSITVSGAANRAPTISGVPATSATAGAQYVFQPTASDPDGQSLTYSITNRPSWASFSTAPGRLSGTPSSSNVGTSSGIVIRVSDGSLSAALATFSITVSGAANRAPTISGLPATSATAGVQYVFQPTASDPDGQSLTYSITNKPSWASFSTATGRLSGTPSSSNVGTSTGIVIRVSDGSLSAALATFSITVAGAANRAPTISGTPPAVGAVGSLYSFRPTASDPDGDPLTWSITAKPSAATFSVSTGELSWTPTAAGAWSGIVITVTDNKGASASLSPFTITVPPPASAGTANLSWQAPTQYTDGSALPSSALAAYRIYWGTTAASLSRVAEVDSLTVTFTAQGLGTGTHYFAVTAVTVAGVESARSVIGSKTIP